MGGGEGEAVLGQTYLAKGFVLVDSFAAVVPVARYTNKFIRPSIYVLCDS